MRYYEKINGFPKNNTESNRLDYCSRILNRLSKRCGYVQRSISDNDRRVYSHIFKGKISMVIIGYEDDYFALQFSKDKPISLSSEIFLCDQMDVLEMCISDLLKK